MSQFPDPSASAAEIRNYNLLHPRLNLQCTPRACRQYCKPVEIGLGSEFHDAKLVYFQQIFGPEIGFCLFRTVFNAKDGAWCTS
ncbi:hypothetical protein BJX70DRAFT_353964 [Aspergillus crustosus]